LKSKPSTQNSALAGLLFNPEDGGSTFLRNVGELSGYKTVLFAENKIRQETEIYDLILWTREIPQKLTVAKLVKKLNIV
jgi:hypothetical protein